MFKNILIAIFVFIIVAVAVSWLVSGAPQEIREATNLFVNPITALSATTTEGGVRLPAFPSFGYTPISLSDYTGVSFDESTFGEDAQAGLYSIEEEYDTLEQQVIDVRTFGDPSPMRGHVTFSGAFGGPTAYDPQLEYVTLSANFANTAPVDIAGWSLQSVVTGKRAALPQGVYVFAQGAVGTQKNISLAPGGQAIITSGASPVGVSFQENTCVGYLDQFQTFVPSLPFDCPAPSQELPPTAENIRDYGESCIDFVRDLSQCRYYTETFPGDISPSCRLFVREALTYNGCVARNRWRPSFYTGDWRIFIGAQTELWQNGHDVIRLLDERGQTVDVFSY